MKIHQFHVPTHLPLGPVNVHLIADDPLTLVDTGPKLPEALEAIKNGLHSIGKRLEDIQRVILTHLHEDHCGLAGTIQRASGATVFVHPWEGDRLRNFDDYNLYVPLLERAGVPSDVIEKFRIGFEDRKKFVDDFVDMEGIEDGDVIDFERESFDVVHTPGHTPGSVCLFRASDRTLIAADTVLKDITPNPILSPDPLDPSRRFPSLCEYMVSLARIRTFSPTVVHGGHGGDVHDYDAYFNRAVRFQDDRQRKLTSLLNRRGSTAWEASLELFPSAKGGHRFLALSETVAHLDFAVDEGRVALDVLGDVEIFIPTRGAAFL
jgi:glyoxylase-like metal-dependent hydrolase (beta-lactamase superfamily II)